MFRLGKKLKVLVFGSALATLFVSGAYSDDYRTLSLQAQATDTVDVVVTGLRPVTGDINPADIISSAITGENDVGGMQQKFSAQIAKGGAFAEPLYEFEYLPFSMMRVDAKGLENIKNYSATAKVWKNEEFKRFLTESTGMVGAAESWNYGGTGKGQVVAVIDSGVDTSHPMLAGKVIHEACIQFLGCGNGKSMAVGPGTAKPTTPHGTHVAGIIAGESDNIHGVAPEAKIAAIRVMNSRGSSRSLDVLIALDHVLKLVVEDEMPIAAVNLSLGGGFHQGSCYDFPISDAAIYLSIFNVAVVAASGNDGYKNGIANPACGLAVISVGAIDKNWKVADFSNASYDLDILAPGVDIWSSSFEKYSEEATVESMEGTSMAAPHVAGAIAVLRGLYPEMDSYDMLDILKGRQVLDHRNNQKYPALYIPSKGGGKSGEDTQSNPPANLIPPQDNGGTMAITG